MAYLATYKALVDEIINYSRTRRTWTDPNAMQVDAVHVNVNQERQGSGSGSRSDKGKGGEGGKGKFKNGGKGKEKDAKPAGKFEGECRIKKGHEKAECRKMKADLATGKCEKSGKPTGQLAHGDMRYAAFLASELCTECGWFHGEYHPDAADRFCVLPESRGLPGASADRNLAHPHDRTSPAESHGRKPRRR